jgi:hypothetical protein
MRVIGGGLAAGLILYVVPHWRSGPACFAAGILAALLLVQLGARSVVERLAAVLTLALAAWVAGPRAAHHQSLAPHLLGWLLAGSFLSWHLRPRAE